jgi:hypothetical protein
MTTEEKEEVILEIKEEQNITPTKEFFDSMPVIENVVASEKKSKSQRRKFLGRNKKIKRAKPKEGENKSESVQKCSKKIGRPRLSQLEEKKDENVTVISSRSKRTKKIKSIFDPSIFRQRRKRPVESDKSPGKTTATTDTQKKKDSGASRSSDKKSRTTESQNFKIKRNIAECCYVCLEINGLALDKCCQSCCIKAHRKCLENQQSGSVVKVLGKDWLCPACLLCCCCGENVNYGILIVCNSCKLAYHKSCHRPALGNNLIVADIWKCDSCSDSGINHQDNSLKSYSVRTNEWSYKGVVVEDGFQGFSDVEIQPDLLEKSEKLYSSNSPVKKRHLENDCNSQDSEDDEDSFSKNQDCIDKLRSWNCQDVYQYFSEYFPGN